jgi:hypothetical protein
VRQNGKNQTTIRNGSESREEDDDQDQGIVEYGEQGDGERVDGKEDHH